MTLVLNLFSIGAICAGLVFFVAGTVGLLRFPDPLSRLHALTKADNIGLGLVVLGLLPFANGVLGGLKLMVVWVLVQLSGATVGQLIAQSMRRNGPNA
jgi:multicomponent Na+:H+ antiporter subunit G